MNKDLLSSFDTLVLIRVNDSGSDICESSFQYESSDFIHLGFKNFTSFNDVVNSIYRSASICEGIGYYEYCNQIKESIHYCLESGERYSFIIPIRKDSKTHYFIMNINKSGDSIVAMFFYLDEKDNLFNFEDFSSTTFKDTLTGLFNYHTLVSHIKENKRAGYLCLFDLNKFKEINDTLGHETGDDVLKCVANYLISTASMKEIFYRRSGDEFMILIFDENLDYTISLVNRIEEFLSTIPAQLHKDFHCSAAFGILQLSYDARITNNYDIQSKLTDLAMYQAKKNNQVYHLITYKDSIEIVEKGDLENRIKTIGRQIRR